jgi:hypothetical protein
MATASVYVVDVLGLVSDPIDVAVVAPAELALDENCDLADGFSACVEGTLCIPSSEEETVGTCETVFPPVLVDGVSAYNAAQNTIGITVNGTDATADGADVNGFEVSFFDAEGTDLLGQSIGLGMEITVDEVDMSSFSAMFSGSWVDPEEMIESPTTVDVTAFDALGLASNTLTLTVGMPNMVNEGDACDTYGALNACSEGYVCVETCTLEENIDYSCPAEWTVSTLEIGSNMGDNSASAIVSEGGSCGGGGPSDVHSFTAATAGTYHFIARGAEGVDMLIYARSYCGSYIPSFELACNDDYEGLNSGVEVELAEGETTYLFIDSWNAQSGGSYTVTAGNGALPEVQEE